MSSIDPHAITRRPLVLVPALLVCVASCHCVSTEKAAADRARAEKRSPRVNDDKLRLTARFVREGKELILRYEVENRDSRDVYLLNRLPGIPPKRNLSPHHIYIGLDRSASTVRLYKKVADIPDYGGSGPTAPVSPYVTPVRAGTTFREEVRMPLPLRPWEEYGRGAYGPGGAIVGKERSYSQIDFVLGYHWRAPDTKEIQREVQGESVILPSSRTYPEFGELRSERVKLELPVIQPPKK